MQPGLRTINKITAPPGSSVYPRSRLFQRIDAALEKPVLWIQGPTGSGKSTLVASYLESRGLAPIWYRVDKGDEDCATLFYYMGLAANKLVSDDLAPLPLLTKEYQQGLNVFSRRYFENLFSRLPAASVLVFDDYHEAGKGSRLDGVMLNALEEIPPGMKVILISRDGPPATLARLDSQRRLNRISWEDLRLTPEEIEGISRTYGHTSVPGTFSEHLLEKTGGWLAGVIFMLERGSRDVVQWNVSPQETLLDYFDSEVFVKNDVSIQEFLLKTAFMQQFTPQMASQLTGIAAAGSILAELNSRHFFTEQNSGPSLTYKYHPLFRDFLLHRAHGVFPQSDITAIQQHSAAILEAQGQIEQALELCLAARSWGDFCRLLQRIALQMITHGRSATLDAWISEVPDDIIAETPWLLYWLGVCRFNEQGLEARRLYERALALFRADETVDGIYLACSGIVNTYRYTMENWRELEKWIALLDEIMLTYPAFPSPQIELRVSISMYTALVLLQTDHQRIKEWRERLDALLENNKNPFLHVQAVYAMLMHEFWSGNYGRMRLLFESIGPHMAQADIPPLAVVMVKDMETFYYWITAQLELCRQAASEGLETGRSSGINFLSSRMMICRLQAGMIDDEEALSDKYSAEFKSCQPQGGNLNLINYYFCCVMLALLKNDTVRAVSCIDAAEAMVLKIGSFFHESLWQLGKSRVLFAQKKNAEALLHAGNALALSLRINSRNIEFISRLTIASIYLSQNDSDNGLPMLRQALAIGREYDFEYSMWWDSRMIAPLCVKALESGIEVEYVQWLVRRRRLKPEKIPLSCDNWPWPVQVNALGDFRILVDGIPLKDTGKMQKKPIDMLKALIALGGMEKNVGQITDLLWPEAEGDTAKNSFKVTLHRLRQLLGHEEAIQMSSGRLFMDKRFFCTDVWVFDNLLNAAQMQAESGNEAEAVLLTEKALSSYRGDLLETENDKPWVHPLRVRLKNKFVLNIVALGNLFQKRGNMEKALDCYMRGLELAPHDEEIFQNLLKIYLARGLRSEVIKAYQSFRLALAEIGLTPSNRIVTLYKTVLQD